jgi:DNA repair protein RadA/Sms
VTGFLCSECGHRAAKWLGRCPECQSWNSLAPDEQEAKATARGLGGGSEPIPFDEIDTAQVPRVGTGIGEFDRVLGGGVVPGSMVLIGGDPGIGKSTLLLQVAARMAGKPGRVLYVSGEESQAQVRLRGDRLDVHSAGLLLLPETSLQKILESVELTRASCLVVDSIQTTYSESLPSAPGSLAQVRETAARLLFLAKDTGTPVFVIGHVTKEGTLAGPRALEHIVDTVLYFEGERHHDHRILRTTKNRFGPTNELGLFRMTGSGLEPVPDASRLFLGDGVHKGPGSVVLPTIEGTRPILVEVQALAGGEARTQGRRVAQGFDPGRLSLLVAVLERETGVFLSGRDIYINVAGGVQVQDPASDLAVLAALASSLRGVPVAASHVVFGEVGLTGEVRPVGRALERLSEAGRLGFRHAVMPTGGAVPPGGPGCTQVACLGEALAALLPAAEPR